MSESRWGGPPPTDLVPENAPFDEEQRAWLNGFLAGLLGLANGDARGAGAVASGASAAEAGVAAGDPPPAEGVATDPPRGSSAPTPERRLETAAGAPLDACPAPPPLDCSPSRPERAWASGSAARRLARGLDASTPSTRPLLVGSGRPPGEAYRLRVKSQRKLTLADAGSEIREVVLETGEPLLSYRAGDCLAVFPHNDPDLVRALLRAIGARGQELVSTPSGATEVWRCLLEDLDITHVRDETLRLFAEEAGRPQEAGVLRESLSQATPSSFDLLDLLAMFPNSRPSLDRIVATLGALEPRLYAIASSPSYHPGELQLAVRMVRVERGGRERKGVASRYLSDGVFRGDDIFARIQSDRFALPVDRPEPMILLGSGTGVARYRALLQELEARGRRGNTWLIMASCSEGDEALYAAELAAWSRVGVLEHLDVVKPAQRGRRAGAEDVLRKRARRVVSWLTRGAVVYACGEGEGLSAVLNDTLIDVLGRQGKMSRAEATDFLHVLRRDGRYVEEVY